MKGYLKRRRTRSVGAWLFIMLVAIVAGCGAGGINVAKEINSAQAIKVSIDERREDGSGFVKLVEMTDSSTISSLASALDRSLPLGPRARCLGRYRLRFELPDGRTEELEYYCQDGPSFLRGGQPFWETQQVEPPAEFDALIRRILDNG